MELKDYSKYIFLVLLGVLVYLAWKVVVPFIWTIVTAALVAYIFFPLYAWIEKKTKRKLLSALAVVILVLIIVTIPIALLMISLINGVQEGIDYVRTEFSGGDLLSLTCQGNEHAICRGYNRFAGLFPEFDIKSAIISLGSSLKNAALKTLDFFSSSVIRFFVMLYMVFFFLVDGQKILKAILGSLHLKKEHEKGIIKTIEETTRAVIFGSIVAAIIQGTIAAFGYWLIGDVSNAALLGLLTAFFALIPYLGTAIVWLPVSAYVFFTGLINASASVMTRGIALFLFCALIVSNIDNLIKPKLIGDKASIHPALVLLGILGGLKFMGFAGIIIGPLILSMFVKLIDIFNIMRNEL